MTGRGPCPGRAVAPCLGRQVRRIRHRPMRASGHLFGHGHSEFAQLVDLVGVVGEQRNRADAERNSICAATV